MKEILIENKELVLRVYSFFVFLIPWLVAMYWHTKLFVGIKRTMGDKFWTAGVPNKEANEIIKASESLSGFRKKRNIAFISVSIIWVVGFGLLILLMAWLNGKL